MTIGKFTHAIVSRVPKSFQTVSTIDGTCIDIGTARRQHQGLVAGLRALGLDVLELPPDEDSPLSVFVGDCAVILNGVALICRPGAGQRRLDEDTVRAVIKKEIGMSVVDLENNNALLSGADILFTGSEFFVGVGSESNTEGALSVAQTWPEYPCTPIKLEGSRHLKDRMTVAGLDLLAVGSSPNCKIILKRVEQEAINRYQTLTLPEDEAADCIYVNGSLLHNHSIEAPLSAQVFNEKINFPQQEIALSEFSKTGRGLSSLCLLVRKTKNIRKL